MCEFCDALSLRKNPKCAELHLSEAILVQTRYVLVSCEHSKLPLLMRSVQLHSFVALRHGTNCGHFKLVT